jgi:DNA (cytosine-5)-methyltransferase 1
MTNSQLTLFAPAKRAFSDAPLIVDSFAGGGGASLGITMGLGRHVDIAINHDREAIALHARNHPQTEHHCEDIWSVDPVAATRGAPVSLLWASPDCRHFSRAKGGRPTSNSVRSLAWVVVDWAKKAKPNVILLENVEEFQSWGPLLADGRPDKDKAGTTFTEWTGQLRALGYELQYRQLRACDYGAPTTRRRLFIIARRDGKPIVWPTPTHGPGRAQPHRTAAECIDWTIPVPSIFDRKKPLAEATCTRIALGVKKFVIDEQNPFIVPHSADPNVIAVPALIQTGYGERVGQAPRVLDLQRPLGTAVAGGVKHALVYAFIARHFTGVIGRSLNEPLPTITTKDHHSLVTAFLVKYYGTGGDQPVTRPIDTITTKDRFALVTVQGVPHILDIGMRMLTPRELARAQGFPDSYALETTCHGEPLSRTAQTRLIGNSVCPPVAAALVAANVNDDCGTVRLAA